MTARQSRGLAEGNFPRRMVQGVGAAQQHEQSSRAAIGAAMQSSSEWLLDRQHADGHWCAELQGDTILESEYILLLAWQGEERSPQAIKAARYLLECQRCRGGWSQYPGGPLEISVSVKAYFALKLTGHDPDSEAMRRARQAIRDAGGADLVNSFTRFYLALLGQIPYECCPAVPPELILLPNWFPVNIYRMSAWSRTIVVPLSIVAALRPVRHVDADRGIRDLFLREPADWPVLRCPGKEQGGLFSWERFFRFMDRALKGLEACGIRPLRSRSLRTATEWMISRFADSDGLGAIFPPIVWSLAALKSLGYSDESGEVIECRRQLESLAIDDHETRRLQPCKSPVWDTAIALRALAAARAPAQSLETAMSWLLKKEVRCDGDWRQFVAAQPAGWFFEYRNAFYPDVDDTIMVMMALRESAKAIGTYPTEVQDAIGRALSWILAMQNRDGGWGAFDRDNDREFLCHVPFADHNAMIDPSTPDITGRVLEALAPCGLTVGHPAVDRAVEYLRKTQEEDGSWFGRWGVNYIYGTWQVLTGLARAGLPPDDEAAVRGSRWLIRHQMANGAWGESADSYADPSIAGKGPATASQTAWALLGLMAAGRHDHRSVRRGIEYLIDTQQPDGSWLETEFTGTGFPRVFYLRYHMYPQYFPLLALARYSRHFGEPCLRIDRGEWELG
jgi:squalene-hopene/tetraprenyl-beta-curcumene cyclase